MSAITILFVLALLPAGYAFMEARRLTFTFVRRVVPQLSRPHRLLLLSDLHLTAASRAAFSRLERAAIWGRAHGAEAALLAGDILESDRDATAVLSLVRDALWPLRVLAVLGNHEHGGPPRIGPMVRQSANDVALIQRALVEAGFEAAEDSAVELGELTVIGTRWTGWELGPSPGARQLLERGAGPVLLLAHSPDQIVGAPAGRVSLAVCGHTHGGQIRFPVIGAVVTQTRTRLPEAAGAMVLAGIMTYVSRGLGHGVPLRLGSPPEAVLIELAADRSNATPRGAQVVEL